MPAKIHLANRTIWALEDIMAICIDGRRQLTDAIDHAEKHGDINLVASLARLSNHLADIERLAKDARIGRYEDTRTIR